VRNPKIHTHGDLIFVRSTEGRARAYEVQADGSLLETHPGTAQAVQEARDIATAEQTARNTRPSLSSETEGA
jgi:hypothetical protein